ncbi:hypothetical protein GUJ93_ZPchr0012g21141 [Zizania palustris]|uniref:Uncharacterized protein n=1 Tax=Zizania palustris TaxID=103762 RepID=A0A8J5WQA4_ZIZPA|nr:hypothetical protein GUJ93_ZPchr0012g21141 [Zizania palustris]
MRRSARVIRNGSSRTPGCNRCADGKRRVLPRSRGDSLQRCHSGEEAVRGLEIRHQEHRPFVGKRPTAPGSVDGSMTRRARRFPILPPPPTLPPPPAIVASSADRSQRQPVRTSPPAYGLHAMGSNAEPAKGLLPYLRHVDEL